MRRPIIITLLASLISSSAFPCTAFVIPAPAGALVGKTYDWDDGSGLVVVNPRGLEKRSVVFGLNERSVRWTSRYASLTFNQYGPEFPNGGMNENGLVAEILWLDESRFPARGADGKPSANQVQWVQYLLDTAGTLDEAIERAQGLHIYPLLDSPTHYFVCDRSGACATFEYLKEKLVISRGARALTNHTFADSMANLATYEGFGGRWPVPAHGIASLTRFAVASKYSAECPPTADCAFDVLKRVHVSDTQWSIVYDTARGLVHFRSEKAPEAKTVDLRRFDGACGSAPRILDINALIAGDVSDHMVRGTRSQIRGVLMQNAALRGHPILRELILLYPAITACR